MGHTYIKYKSTYCFIYILSFPRSYLPHLAMLAAGQSVYHFGTNWNIFDYLNYWIDWPHILHTVTKGCIYWPWWHADFSPFKTLYLVVWPLASVTQQKMITVRVRHEVSLSWAPAVQTQYTAIRLCSRHQVAHTQTHTDWSGCCFYRHRAWEWGKKKHSSKSVVYSPPLWRTHFK